MAIEFVGASSGSGAIRTSSAHQAGDLVVAFAYRDGNATAPTLPALWNRAGSSGGSTNSSVLAYRWATGSATSASFTNATETMMMVYRGVGVTGSIAGAGAVSTTISYPALTLASNNGNSWIIAVAGHRSVNTTIETPPGNTVRRGNIVATGEIAGFDTNANTGSWGGYSVSVGGTNSGYRSWTFELTSGSALVADGYEEYISTYIF